jgi:DNA-binding GntR family transcriptional regulator
MTGRGWEIVAGLVELDRTSLRERAMDRLRSAVTSREIEPGTRLVETDLSAALGISRDTLREALRQLEYEGLIESTERGRLTVRSLSRTELADMFAVRAALEGLAATAISLLADRAGPLTGLQTAVNLLGSTDGSIGALVEADLAFHALLCRLSGNAPLMRAWETLTGPIRVAILFAGPTAARANMSADRHQQLLDAIATGDARTARAAVEVHMEQAARTLLDRPPDPGTLP